MQEQALNELRLDLSVKAKNGIDFIIAATVIWMVNSYLWTLPTTSYNKSVFTFIAGGLMLPLAYGLSKLLKTQWTIKENPLQPLGLWLNFAQLFYFPFLIFILLRQPDYFLMTYAIITGAHFLPYAWFYREKAYAVMAGLIPIGSFLLALFLEPENMYFIGLYVAFFLVVLTLWLFVSFRKKINSKI